MYELMVEDTFDAAHALRGYQGPCENLHGHTWKVQIFLQGDKLNKIGILADFRDIKKALKDVIARFDHCNLNDLPEFKEENASSENLSRIIFENLRTYEPMNLRIPMFRLRRKSGSRSSEVSIGTCSPKSPSGNPPPPVPAIQLDDLKTRE